VYTLGNGEVGQLGHGPEVLTTAMARRIPGLCNVVQVDAGGMHTVCVDIYGRVLMPWLQPRSIFRLDALA